MAGPTPEVRQSPATLSSATVQRIAGKVFVKLLGSGLETKKFLEPRLKKAGYATLDGIPASELQEISRVGTGKLTKDEYNSLSGSVSSVRDVSRKNVVKLAKSFIEKGFNQGFPLTVGILPVHEPRKEVSLVDCLFLSELSYMHEFVAGASKCRFV